MGASLLALAKSIYYCILQEEYPMRLWKTKSDLNLINLIIKLLF